MNAKELTIGFSPCPNDTFIFYGLMHDRIAENSFLFAPRLEDVETLNQMAMRSSLDVTKVSCHALGYIQDDYCLLRSGSALGRGCGPLVVARERCSIDDLAGKKMAVPGKFTTAFLLLQLFNPLFGENVVFMPFHMIMESVEKGEVDAGVIIHEGRFTFPFYGLHEVLNLGAWWEEETALPLPLGAIVAKRSLGKNRVQKLESLIRMSLDYAYAHRDETMPYVKRHAQELSDEVIKRHIALYVNSFSHNLDDEGEKAICMLFRRSVERGIFPETDKPLFVQ